MRYLFIVQGEGRGHLTQAISLKNILIKNDHEITKVIVGKSTHGEIPGFFTEKIKSGIVRVESPSFVTDKKNIRIRITRTIFYNLFHSRRFLNSLKTIKQIVDTKKPVMIIPTAGHYKQTCNALDASFSGAGIVSESFDLSRFIEYIPLHNQNYSEFRNWVKNAEVFFIYHLVHSVNNYSIKKFEKFTFAINKKVFRKSTILRTQSFR